MNSHKKMPSGCLVDLSQTSMILLLYEVYPYTWNFMHPRKAKVKSNVSISLCKNDGAHIHRGPFFKERKPNKNTPITPNPVKKKKKASLNVNTASGLTALQ